MIVEADLLSEPLMTQLLDEVDQLCKILGQSINTARHASARLSAGEFPNLPKTPMLQAFCRAIFRAQFADGHRIDDTTAIGDILAELKLDPEPALEPLPGSACLTTVQAATLPWS